MKIILILPIGSIHRHGTGNFGKSLRYAPLTLITLASLVPMELNAEIEIVDESVESADYETLQADIVGISVITGTSMRGYKIADILRRRGITVVLGGVHATLMPEEAMAHADSVVTGMAELTWPQLLRDFSAGTLKAFYHQSPGLRIEGFPPPRRDLLRKDRYLVPWSIQATRGCPNVCDFCVIPSTWGANYYLRPVREVVEEFEALEGSPVVFLDPSPIEDPDYAKRLYRELIAVRKDWVGLSTIRMAYDRELLDLASRSGCRGLLIGFESVSQETLKVMNKDFNRAYSYSEMVRRFHGTGIAVQGCFVFGFDTDDVDVFKRTVDFVLANNIDLPRYSVYTPFPNTPAFRRLESEGRIIERDWTLYDVEHVVFRPRRMTADQLRRGLHWAWRQSYGIGATVKRLAFSGLMSDPFFMRYLTLTNMGYRHYAMTLHEFTDQRLRDQT